MKNMRIVPNTVLNGVEENCSLKRIMGYDHALFTKISCEV